MTVTSMVRLLAAAVLVVGLAGCSGGEQSPPGPTFANWPKALQNFRFGWDAEPGIDLVSGPAVPLRADLESYRVTQLTQDIAAPHPGVDRPGPPPLPPPPSSSPPPPLVALPPPPPPAPPGP